MLSAYELQRDRTIAENHKVMQGLGLESLSGHEKLSKRRMAATTRPPPKEPSRKSPRRGGASAGSSDTSATAEAVHERIADVASWETGIFKMCESSVNGYAVWDAAKHHQHLTRSSSGRSIATTGVAGYGAALARKVVGCRRWSVRAVRFGVGGFGVGVVSVSMRPPFKSIGKSPHSLGSYHSNGMLATERGEQPFGPAYEPGDVVTVVLRPSATKPGGKYDDVIFLLNGKEVGVAASRVAAGTVIIAVQPYMGGVACLES